MRKPDGVAGGDPIVTLYGFGPFFGRTDGGPFVMKAMIPLKMAGVPFVEDRGGLLRAPKGKPPFPDDSGEIVTDSTLIRRYVERKYGYDFDAGAESGRLGRREILRGSPLLAHPLRPLRR